MIKDGDANEGRSANKVQCCNEDKYLAVAGRKELRRNVYLPL